MHCPKGDNNLIEKSPRHDGAALHYLECPTCRGHWLSAFDANYIKSINLPDDYTRGPLTKQGVPLENSCPQCRKNLERATGDNIPPDVLAFRCPDGHGYFFPAGELKKFKEAQEVKLAYHKQWQVPLSSVASAMLMTLVGLILSGGLIAGVIEGQKQQTITSQAADMIISHKAYADSQAVTIIALTTEPVILTAIVDGIEYQMIAPDEKSHVVRVTNLVPGGHQYRFRFQKEGKVLASPVYSFSSF